MIYITVTNGPNWSNHTNWLTKAPVSTWYGIIVRRQRVWQIRLSQNNLSGSISSSIGDRDGLALLDLSYKSIRRTDSLVFWSPKTYSRFEFSA
jgi:hypothetical protein